MSEHEGRLFCRNDGLEGLQLGEGGFETRPYVGDGSHWRDGGRQVEARMSPRVREDTGGGGGQPLGTSLLGTEEGMGPRIREDTGGGGGQPLGTSLLGTEEGMGPRIREDKGGGGQPLGTSLLGTEEGMGPRIREDKGGG